MTKYIFEGDMMRIIETIKSILYIIKEKNEKKYAKRIYDIFLKKHHKDKDKDKVKYKDIDIDKCLKEIYDGIYSTYKCKAKKRITV